MISFFGTIGTFTLNRFIFEKSIPITLRNYHKSNEMSSETATS